MTRVLARDVIERALAGIDLLPLIEAGFAAYSAGRCNIPPVGELVLEKGEVHIKYGCITGDRYYVVKIASGFYGNPALGLASSNGLIPARNDDDDITVFDSTGLTVQDVQIATAVTQAAVTD